VVYLLFNVSFNVLLLWLTKRMSATWATIATVLCLDLTCLFSMSPVLLGDEAQPVTFQQYLGLILAGVAMWTYNLRPERDAEGRLVEGAHVDAAAAGGRPSALSSLSLAAERVGSAGYGVRISAGRANDSTCAREEGSEIM